MGSDLAPPEAGGYHIRNYIGVILALLRRLRKGKARICWDSAGIHPRVVAAGLGAGETHRHMAAHMASTDRRRRGRALLLALGIGLLAVVVIVTTRGSPDRTADRPATSAPTVLGATVTSPPRAAAATPATFDLPDSTTASTRASAPTTPRATTSTTGPAEVIDPVIVDNTTSTAEPEPTTTTESPTSSTG